METVNAYAVISISQNGDLRLWCHNDKVLPLEVAKMLVGGYIEVCNIEPILNAGYNDIRMVVDEEGLFKDYKVNVIASALYNSRYGLTPIVGDVFLCVQGYLDDGDADIMYMPFDKAQRLFDFLQEIKQAILDRYGTLNGDNDIIQRKKKK